MRKHGEARLGRIFFEKLGLQVNRQIADLFLRKNRLLNLFFCGLSGILSGARSVIAAASLNIEFLFAGESDLQSVKTAVELEVLRRESEQIRGHRGSDGLAQRNVNVIAIVIES